MSSYRFCRTDDIGLLVDALNRCWLPHFPGEAPVTPAGFKRSIRDLQVWCSSCMVAYSGGDPIAVLIGAKRSSGTLIHRIAVHPDHLRQGHGRHLLTSISSKLAILGPPRIVTEVPQALAAACALFEACGYTHEATPTDYVRGRDDSPTPNVPAGCYVIPVTVDDLVANGLLGSDPPSPLPTARHASWERSVETLMARKDEISGLAVASDERIEAYILRRDDDVMALRSLIDDGGDRLGLLLSATDRPLTFRKVHAAEISEALLGRIGFRPAAGHMLFSTVARSA